MRSDYYFECISGRTEKRDELRKKLDEATAVELSKAPAPPTPQELAAREAKLAAKQREQDELETTKRRLRNKGRHSFSGMSWSHQVIRTEHVKRCPNDVITPTVQLPGRRPASAVRLIGKKQQQQQHRGEETYGYTTEDVDRWLEESDDDSIDIDSGKEEQAEDSSASVEYRRSEVEDWSAHSLSGQPSGPWGWMPTEHRRQLAAAAAATDRSQWSSSAPRGRGPTVSRPKSASSAGSSVAPSRRHRHLRTKNAAGGLVLNAEPVREPVWPESEVLVSQVVQQFMYRELHYQQLQYQQQGMMLRQKEKHQQQQQQAQAAGSYL